MEGTMATVTLFAANFAPKNWAYCQGQILAISSNTALFSLLGTTYGGNGQTTFALPNMSGRVPVGTGAGPGLPQQLLGEISGTPNNTMLISNMPAHNHQATVTIQVPINPNGVDVENPEGAFLGVPDSGKMYYSNAPAAGQFMGNLATTANAGITGGSQPINNMQPYLTLNYIICLYGIYPSRN